MTRFLVVFDVDSTLINEEAIEVLADFANVRNEVAKITEQAMLGEIDFKESLIRRVRMLEGVPETKLFEVKQSLTLTYGAVELVSAIHSRGGTAAAVSGGFTQLLDGVQENLKLDLVRANTLEIHDGYLTGRVIEPVIEPVDPVIDPVKQVEVVDNILCESIESRSFPESELFEEKIQDIITDGEAYFTISFWKELSKGNE